MRFSQRIGLTPIKSKIQIESIDKDLLNRLWSLLLENFFDKIPDYIVTGQESSRKAKICKLIWKEFFKLPVDEIHSYSNSKNVYCAGFIEYIKKWFYQAKWFEIYDLIEYIILIDSEVTNFDFAVECNLALKKEVSGYRILNLKIVQITSEEEIQAIEEASLNTDNWNSVNTHLKTALDLLADRKNPDYRNSIKESISAVESFCKIITGDEKATLGKALSEIEKNYKLHNALKSAFSSIYGYTSDSSGIRHSLLEDDNQVEFEDAKFILVSCSAFINYLKSKIKF